MSEPLFHLVCGSTGAGKSTYSGALAEQISGVHFSIDDWMARLFWADSPQPIRFDWTIERVNRCEGQIADIALKLANRSVPSVLDLGFSRAEHRAKFAAIAAVDGVGVQLHVLDWPADERWRRVTARNAEKGETYRLEVTREMFDFMESIWEPPTAGEMAAMGGVVVGR